MQNEKIDVGFEDGHDYKIIKYVDDIRREYYELLNVKSPYAFNIRLKPWITAISRNMTAEVVLQNIDKVVRVQTDSISFTEKMTFDNPYLLEESKTTGLIHFHDVNCYWNKTNNYKSKQYDRIVNKKIMV